MAKYTLLLSEYLKDGFSLPSSFSLIDGFKEAFIGKYCDKEIGFETEELFQIKLEARANLVMQNYADKIAKRAAWWAKAESPAKTYYSKDSLTSSHGSQKTQNTELPIDSQTAEPNAITEAEAYEDKDERIIERTNSGQDAGEVIEMLNFLNKDVSTLVEKCLGEFKNLFMGVY